MTWVANTIRDFGLGMGIEDLSFNSHGVLCLAFETMGTLFVERTDGAVLVYLVRDMPLHERGFMSTALALCHYREGLPVPINAGFKGERQLTYVARVDESDFSLPTLEETVNLLHQLHEKTLEKNA